MNQIIKIQEQDQDLDISSLYLTTFLNVENDVSLSLYLNYPNILSPKNDETFITFYLNIKFKDYETAEFARDLFTRDFSKLIIATRIGNVLQLVTNQTCLVQDSSNSKTLLFRFNEKGFSSNDYNQDKIENS